jgi:hypothetical protein
MQFLYVLLASISSFSSLLLSPPCAPSCRVDLCTQQKILQYQKALTLNFSLSLSLDSSLSRQQSDRSLATMTTYLDTKPRSSWPLFIHYHHSPTSLGRNLGVQNPRYQNPRSTWPIFSGLRQPVFPFFSRGAPKHPMMDFPTCWVHPWSFFIYYLSSPISSSNDFLSRASLHLFCSFFHFDPITVTVSSAQFTFSFFFLDIRLLPYPRANTWFYIWLLEWIIPLMEQLLSVSLETPSSFTLFLEDQQK